MVMTIHGLQQIEPTKVRKRMIEKETARILIMILTVFFVLSNIVKVVR